MELILIMALVTVVISLSGPSLGNFFRGRSLDSEARRLLALTRQGQSRAVSEGVPMELWFDSEQHKVGLECDATYDAEDARAVEFEVSPDLEMEIEETRTRKVFEEGTVPFSGDSTRRERRRGLPQIQFRPDGRIAETSPGIIRLIGRDGTCLQLQRATNGMQYELTWQANKQ